MGWTLISSQRTTGPSYIAAAFVDRSASLVQIAKELLFSRLIRSAIDMYWLFGLPTIPGTVVDNLAGTPIFVVGLIVGLTALFAAWPMAFSYLVLYVSVLLIWPWMLGRFFVPLLPLVVATTLVGIERSLESVRPARKTVAVFLVAGIIALNGMVTVYGIARQRTTCDRSALVPSSQCLSADQAGFFSAIGYIREHVPPDAVFFLGSKPAPFYLYSGRRTIATNVALSQPPSEFLPYLLEQGANYVLLSPVMPLADRLPALVKGACKHLQLEMTFPHNSFLFRIRSDPDRADSSGACRAVDAFVDNHPQRPRTDSWRHADDLLP
jgi:hypothetical protein